MKNQWLLSSACIILEKKWEYFDNSVSSNLSESIVSYDKLQKKNEKCKKKNANYSKHVSAFNGSITITIA